MSLPQSISIIRPLGGGSINSAFQVQLQGGSLAFMKTRAGVREGEYEIEAQGLRWLAEAQAIDIPRVLDVAGEYLLLQWIQPGRLSEKGEERLGHGLANLHQAGARNFGDPGFSEPSHIGSLKLPNAPTSSWPDFYARRRLEPLAKLAFDCGALTDQGVLAISRVCERLGALAGPDEPPARLHGDLWSGNVMADSNGAPWLIDPTVYGGHREVDLAMLRLFGAPSERVFDAYEEISPLAEGWRERVELWQLAPLLVHAVLFGGSYCEAAARIAIRYSN